MQRNRPKLKVKAADGRKASLPLVSISSLLLVALVILLISSGSGLLN